MSEIVDNVQSRKQLRHVSITFRFIRKAQHSPQPTKSFYRNIYIETAVDVQVPRSRMNKQKSPQR